VALRVADEIERSAGPRGALIKGGASYACYETKFQSIRPGRAWGAGGKGAWQFVVRKTIGGKVVSAAAKGRSVKVRVEGLSDIF